MSISAETSQDQEVIARDCRGLIDSEYDSIAHFECSDLWYYLGSLYQHITRETSDSLYAEFF